MDENKEIYSKIDDLYTRVHEVEVGLEYIRSEMKDLRENSSTLSGWMEQLSKLLEKQTGEKINK